MDSGAFQLPAVFDLAATFFFGVTGALAGIRRGYDVVGVAALALLTGVGGAVIRDGIFLQAGPPAVVRDPRYLYAILAALAAGVLVRERIERFGRFVALLDAVGLGTYAVFGTQKALAASLAPAVAVLIGVINACGGGLLRDVTTREEPLVFKPGQYYVLAALAGAVLFVALTAWTPLAATASGLVASGATFLLRLLAIHRNWKTRSFYPPPGPG